VPTQDEIKTRLRLENVMWTGCFAADVLGPLVEDEYDREMWRTLSSHHSFVNAPVTPEQLTIAMNDYLRFAIGQALYHRGLSANRSLIKLRSFAFALDLGEADAVLHDTQIATRYTPYGMPLLKSFAQTIKQPWPPVEYTDHAQSKRDLELMASGASCTACASIKNGGCNS